jgi:hypothetical protein
MDVTYITHLYFCEIVRMYGFPRSLPQIEIQSS